MPNARRKFAVVLTLLALLAAAALYAGGGPEDRTAAARAALTHRNGGFAGSEACLDCHADRHATWAATYHRTMTQLPSEETVQGDFDGRLLRWNGGAARPKKEDGAHYVEVHHDGEKSRTAEVALLVGSHRYQQLFERVRRDGGWAFVRLPIVWSNVEKRWTPLHAVFLEPDGTDAFRHASDWNANCVFCHNTAPEPRLANDVATVARRAGAFDSKVADLGIACESCHGPGAAHAVAMRDPQARARAEAGESVAPMVDPRALPPDRSVAVCAQCHGQRLPHPVERAADWIRTGPTFRAGDRLEDHVELVRRDTPPPPGEDPELFRRRFWNDGTPRLTAYEAQGLTDSPCHAQGGLTCHHCHAMHAGDPAGQLRPGHEGDRACASCHDPVRYGARAHTGHGEGGAGASCVACHMPRVVYGVLDLHRSHRIEIPDPRRDGEAGRPHACTLCHLDRSLVWAADELTKLHGKPFPPPIRRGDRAARDAADGFASLLAGDPVVRAVYARAFGDAPSEAADAPGGPPRDSFAGRRLSFEFSRRALLAVTLGDAYPAVRTTAHRAALRLDASQTSAFRRAVLAFDPQLADEARRPGVFRALDRLRSDAALLGEDLFPKNAPPPFGWGEDRRPNLDAMSALLQLQDGRAISIGE